jgi:hypothetical protein
VELVWLAALAALEALLELDELPHPATMAARIAVAAAATVARRVRNPRDRNAEMPFTSPLSCSMSRSTSGPFDSQPDVNPETSSRRDSARASFAVHS